LQKDYIRLGIYGIDFISADKGKKKRIQKKDTGYKARKSASLPRAGSCIYKEIQYVRRMVSVAGSLTRVAWT